jgi:hypothetical protein
MIISAALDIGRSPRALDRGTHSNATHEGAGTLERAATMSETTPSS